MRPLLQMDAKTAHAASGSLCSCCVEFSILPLRYRAIDFRHDGFQRNIFFRTSVLIPAVWLRMIQLLELRQMLMVPAVHIQRQLQNILPHEDRKGSRPGHGLSVVVTAMIDQRLFTLSPFACHDSKVRTAVMVLRPVVARFLL